MGSLQPEDDAEERKQELDDSGCVQDAPVADSYVGSAHLLDMSDDVLLYLLRYLSPRDLKALGHTCPRLGLLACDHTLWQRVDARHQPTGQQRLKWYIKHCLSAATQELKLMGYVDVDARCLGIQDLTNPAQKDAAGGTGEVDVEHFLLRMWYPHLPRYAMSPRWPNNAEAAGRSYFKPNTSNPNAAPLSPLSQLASQIVAEATGHNENRPVRRPRATTSTNTDSTSTSTSTTASTSASSSTTASSTNLNSSTPASSSDSMNVDSSSSSTQSLDTASTSNDGASTSKGVWTSDQTASTSDEKPSTSSTDTDMYDPSSSLASSVANGSKSANGSNETSTKNDSESTKTDDAWAKESTTPSQGARSEVVRKCPGPQFTINTRLMRALKAKCQNLTALALEYCNLDYKSTNLRHFPSSLKWLSLKGTRCYNLPLNTSYLGKVQDRLPLLEYLDISECEWFEPASLMPLSKVPKLRELYMKQCRRLTECVAYASLATRYGFQNLKILDMRGSPVADSEVSAFGWLPNLEELYVSPPEDFRTTTEHAHRWGDVFAPFQELDHWERDVPEHFRCKSPESMDVDTDSDDENENRVGDVMLGNYINCASLERRIIVIHPNRQGDVANQINANPDELQPAQPERPERPRRPQRQERPERPERPAQDPEPAGPRRNVLHGPNCSLNHAQGHIFSRRPAPGVILEDPNEVESIPFALLRRIIREQPAEDMDVEAGPSKRRHGDADEDLAKRRRLDDGSPNKGDKAMDVAGQQGPSQPQAGPSGQVAGPSKPQAGPSTAQAGSSKPEAVPMDQQAGPSNSQAGPSNPEAGPSKSQVEPMDLQSGPSNTQAGPMDQQAGPSKPQAVPMDQQAGPSNPEVGPSNPEAGPSNPEAGPSNPEAGPSNPEAGPSNPEAGPSNPEAGPSNPEASGLSPKLSAQMERVAKELRLSVARLKALCRTMPKPEIPVEKKGPPKEPPTFADKQVSTVDYLGTWNQVTGDYNPKSIILRSNHPAGLLSEQMRPVNPQAGPSNVEAGPSNAEAGPSNVEAGPSNAVPGPSQEQPGPSQEQPGPSNMEAGPSNVKPRPSQEQPGPSNPQPRPPSPQPGPSNVEAGPSNVQPGPSQEQPGPSNPQPRPPSPQPGPSNQFCPPDNGEIERTLFPGFWGQRCLGLAAQPPTDKEVQTDDHEDLRPLHLDPRSFYGKEVLPQLDSPESLAAGLAELEAFEARADVELDRVLRRRRSGSDEARVLIRRLIGRADRDFAVRVERVDAPPAPVLAPVPSREERYLRYLQNYFDYAADQHVEQRLGDVLERYGAIAIPVNPMHVGRVVFAQPVPEEEEEVVPVNGPPGRVSIPIPIEEVAPTAGIREPADANAGDAANAGRPAQDANAQNENPAPVPDGNAAQVPVAENVGPNAADARPVPVPVANAGPIQNRYDRPRPYRNERPARERNAEPEQENRRYRRRCYPAVFRHEGQPVMHIDIDIQHHNIPPASNFGYHLVTDSAVLRFGRAENDHINYVHIGQRNNDTTHRPDRSNLRILSITGYRNITDRSLEHLATAAPFIHFIDFTDTNVSDRGAEMFKAMRPNCTLLHSNYRAS
ncbi:uncharacterized protein LOC142985616 isoform X2 [Anticarsia gemmatalis]|uniref:uncharacterized protein LOC142985616 isoform X2 n=1 Tax=Anticarsia gemmatalis TaxID=129554 RepID=UPI003F75FC33